MTSTGTVSYSWGVEQTTKEQAFNDYMLITRDFLKKIGHRIGSWLPVIDRNFINDPETTDPDSLTIITVESKCEICDQTFRCVMEKISYFRIRGEYRWDWVVGRPRSFLHVTSFEAADLLKLKENDTPVTYDVRFYKEFLCSRFKNLA